MNLSKAQQWALTSALAGGSLSALKDLILNRKTKSWAKILRDAVLISGIAGGAGYLTNKGISNYIYNSMKDIPFGYNQKALKIALKPKGENLWDKVKDIASKATSTPDLESIGKGLKAEDLKPYAELAGDEGDAIGSFYNLYNNPEKLTDKWKDNFRIYVRSLPYRRELFARNLGIFDDSKGSLFKELDVSDINGNLKGLFKNFDKVLMPKDVNKFKFTTKPKITYFGEVASPLSNFLPRNLKDNQKIIIDHPTLGNATMIHDKNSNTIAIGDIWDFKPNGYDFKSYNTTPLVDKLRNLYSILFENPVPVYTEANIKDIL